MSEEFEQTYELYAHPYRGGILSDRERHNPKISRKRLIRDAESILWMLHVCVEDLISGRHLTADLSIENNRLRGRCSYIYNLLTQEQKDRLYEMDMIDYRQKEKLNETTT